MVSRSQAGEAWGFLCENGVKEGASRPAAASPAGGYTSIIDRTSMDRTSLRTVGRKKAL